MTELARKTLECFYVRGNWMPLTAINVNAGWSAKQGLLRLRALELSGFVECFDGKWRITPKARIWFKLTGPAAHRDGDDVYLLQHSDIINSLDFDDLSADVLHKAVIALSDNNYAGLYIRDVEAELRSEYRLILKDGDPLRHLDYMSNLR